MKCIAELLYKHKEVSRKLLLDMRSAAISVSITRLISQDRFLSGKADQIRGTNHIKIYIFVLDKWKMFFSVDNTYFGMILTFYVVKSRSSLHLVSNYILSLQTFDLFICKWTHMYKCQLMKGALGIALSTNNGNWLHATSKWKFLFKSKLDFSWMYFSFPF